MAVEPEVQFEVLAEHVEELRDVCAQLVVVERRRVDVLESKVGVPQGGADLVVPAADDVVRR